MIYNILQNIQIVCQLAHAFICKPTMDYQPVLFCIIDSDNNNTYMSKR